MKDKSSSPNSSGNNITNDRDTINGGWIVQRGKIGDKERALEEFKERKEKSLDKNRVAEVEKRHAKELRTARENLEALCDQSSFIEYGEFVVAAQRSRKSPEELIEKTSGDGVITGLATINAELVGERKAQVALVINDYSVLAATQGYFHHKKLDRIFSVARENSLPVVMYTEGGGGRPGDTDALVFAAGLEISTFMEWAALGSLKIAVNRGYCFAGSALLLGCADIKIATRDSYIGMAGPAMIEGGGLGKFAPEEIGPAAEQSKLGAIDVLVDDEEQATRLAKSLLGYFQGDISDWDSSNQALAWDAMPDDRRYSYDVRKIINVIADTNTFIELQPDYGRAIVQGLARIEGKAVAIIANDTRVLGGAIDAQAADKAARFLKLCEKTQMPVVSFCDTPGFMVGPDSEKQGAVKAMSDMYIEGSKLSVPVVSILLRKGYGLGAMAMSMGSFFKPVYSAAWPTGEFGGMGLEGAVHLGFKRELEAAASEQERQALFDQLLAELYEKGKASEVAAFAEIDAVIDPADTRQVILRALSAAR